jgi:uncharacterized protein (TIGR03382 family)
LGLFTSDGNVEHARFEFFTIPEPGGIALAGLGLLGLAALGRRYN